MKSRLILLLLGIVTTVPVSAATPAAPEALLNRGRYLVEGIGLCADCHTPRNEKGEFVTAHALRGAKIDFAPTVPMPAWAEAAPPIAGLPAMTVEQAVKFMMDGRRPDGSFPRPPMPAYRFNEEDARALVAYLKSLDNPPAVAAAAAR
jgi:mono/diheme cytochrome c family protein